tara:strand:+ start:58 stop:1791 length:1734 start_codon:yes stop_codon:yes gene_type:complete
MPYHYNTSSGTSQSTTNAQGQVAPPGYHYMPDGTLMSDAEHDMLHSGKRNKIINLALDTKNILSGGETRRFSITGGPGAMFTLEVKNEDGNFYNFTTRSFQSGSTRLLNKTINNSGINYYEIVFPSITDADKYDFYLFAGENTRHADYREVRLGDGSIDINASTGSNSDLLRKTIYQTLKVTLTLSGESPNSQAGWGSVSITTDTVIGDREKESGSKNFKVVATAAATRAAEIIRQPLPSDITCYVSRTIGSAPVLIDKENQYPTVTNTDTVDGAVSSGTKIVMDNNVADNMSVGDKVTGLSDGDGVTVVALNPDGDNVKEFSVSAAVDAGDGATLSFTNQKNYRWPLNNIQDLKPGMSVLGTNVTASTKIADYSSNITINSDTENEYSLLDVEVPALDTLGAKPSISRNAITNVVTTTQTGNVVFNKQQILLLASDTVKIYADGPNGLKDLYGYEIELSDLKVELTEVSTTTTAAVSSSTSIPITERAGILDNVSTISGIGIDPTAADPTVASGAGTVSGSGTIVASAAQTLESGITLTFPGASRIATITGNINVKNMGNTDATLYFNLEKFLKAT